MWQLLENPTKVFWIVVGIGSVLAAASWYLAGWHK
jgi:hypothetical protein